MSTSASLINRQAPPLVGTHSSTGDGSPQHFSVFAHRNKTDNLTRHSATSDPFCQLTYFFNT